MPSVPRFRESVESCTKKQTQTPDWPLTKGILKSVKKQNKSDHKFHIISNNKKKQLKIASIQNSFSFFRFGSIVEMRCFILWQQVCKIWIQIDKK